MQNGVLLLVALIVAFLMLEGLLRLVPTWFMDYRSNIRYIPDRVVGYKLKPDQRVTAASTCYKIRPVVTNSVGFRDSEPVKDRYDVAVLGDSYLEAAQIPEDLHTSRLIERILNVNVLSTAVGGYGTINEFFCYREYMAKYRPRVVLLFFCGNDISDNDCKTSLKGALCADMTKQGEVVISPSDAGLIKFKEHLRATCRSCYGAAKLLATLKAAFAEHRAKSSNPPLPAAPPGTPSPVRAPSGTPAPEPVRAENALPRNWLITEHFLSRLNDEVRKNGGTLVVVPIDDSPSMRPLAGICRKNRISLLSIDEDLAKYRTAFNLPAPYFAYRCDGHWNPLAHFLVANGVSRFLLKENLIEGKDRSRIMASIDANLRRSPADILGDDAYSQIYRGGFYRGKSRIPGIMADENRASSPTGANIH